MSRILFRILPFLFVLMACDDRPSHILSPSKMEDVLYDYHFMQGIIAQLPDSQRTTKAQDYINAVYEKHGITETQFDQSLVYYNRNTKELYDIYSRLKERCAALNDELQIANGTSDMTAIFATGGDTTNLWNGTPLIVLRENPLLNKYTFAIKADSSFHAGDHFILTFSPTFVRDNKDDARASLHVGLSVRYTNKKHIGATRLCTRDDMQQIALQTDANDTISDITGFFYYVGNKRTRNLCFTNRISLVRMHTLQPTDTVAPSLSADTTAVDSVALDTLAPAETHRLTPEEIRRKNRSEQRINIQQAPSTRSPNRYGVRKRKNR